MLTLLWQLAILTNDAYLHGWIDHLIAHSAKPMKVWS